MPTITCKNCDHTYEGKFCSQCGQKASIQRLNWQSLNEELKYTVLHLNNGLFYSARQLATRPGHTAREFVEGKRVFHYKPLLLVFILAGLNGLLMHYIDYGAMLKNLPAAAAPKGTRFFDPVEMNNWIAGHYALIELMSIPIVSLCSWLAFRKWGYNYIEHIFLNTFASAQRLFYMLLIFPVMYLASYLSGSFIFQGLLTLPAYLFTAHLYTQFFKGRDLGIVILRLMLTAFLSIMLFFILGILGMIGYIIYLKSSGLI